MFVTNSFLFHKTLRLAAGGGAFVIEGVPVTILQLNALTAASQGVSVGAGSAGLRRAARISAEVGAWAVAGPSVLLKRNLHLSAGAASIAVEGRLAALQKSRVAGFVKTEVYIAGQGVSLVRHLRLSADPVAIEIGTPDVGLLKLAGSISVDVTDLTVSGLDVGIRADRLLAADAAAAVVTPVAAMLSRRYPLQATVAEVAIQGRSVGLRVSKRLAAVKSSFAIATPPQTLTAIQAVTSLSFLASAVSTAGSVVIPATAAAGDLAVVFDNGQDSGTIPVITPSGFTSVVVHSGTGGEFNWLRGSYKVLQAGDPGSSLTLTDGGIVDRKIILVFRPNGTITTVTPSTWLQQGTTGNPNAQTISASGQPAPLLALAAARQNTTSFSTNSPAFDAIVAADAGPSVIAGYKVYNSGPANHSVDIGDSGYNILVSGYLRVA